MIDALGPFWLSLQIALAATEKLLVALLQQLHQTAERPVHRRASCEVKPVGVFGIRWTASPATAGDAVSFRYFCTSELLNRGVGVFGAGAPNRAARAGGNDTTVANRAGPAAAPCIRANPRRRSTRRRRPGPPGAHPSRTGASSTTTLEQIGPTRQDCTNCLHVGSEDKPPASCNSNRRNGCAHLLPCTKNNAAPGDMPGAALFRDSMPSERLPTGRRCPAAERSAAPGGPWKAHETGHGPPSARFSTSAKRYPASGSRRCASDHTTSL